MAVLRGLIVLLVRRLVLVLRVGIVLNVGVVVLLHPRSVRGRVSLITKRVIRGLAISCLANLVENEDANDNKEGKPDEDPSQDIIQRPLAA